MKMKNCLFFHLLFHTNIITIKGDPMTEERASSPKMSVEEATKILPIIISNNTQLEDILKVFKDHLSLVDINKGKTAKNTLMQFVVSKQMERQRFFEIVSPFNNSCVLCKGAGEIYKFERKTVMVNCHICAGKKKVTVQCRSCNGTGRYEKRWNSGGGINVTCGTCKGNGSIRVQCSNCRGKGKLKKTVTSHKIKTTTPCKKCDELGFVTSKSKKKKNVPQKRERVVDNPVISVENLSNIINKIPSIK